MTYTFPKAPRIPVWRRSAPAQDNISVLLEKSINGGRTVDSNDVVRMTSDSHMERILSTDLGKVFVCANTSSFKSFGRKLFIFVRHKMYTQRKFINTRLLASQIKNTDLLHIRKADKTYEVYYLGIWNTTVVTRFGVRFVLA